MKRLCIVLSIAAMLGPSAAEAQPYVGPLKQATATFVVRGVDGAQYRINAEAVIPGYGPDDNAQLTLRIARCGPRSCETERAYTRTLAANEYRDSIDVNLITVSTKMGTLELALQWYTPAGTGKGHAPSTDGGVSIRSSDTADAVLLLGAYGRYARCHDPKAKMVWQLGAFSQGYEQPDTWPEAEPAGLRLRKHSTRTPSCGH